MRSSEEHGCLASGRPRRRAPRALALAAGVAVASSGCSFLSARPPSPTLRAGEAPDCKSGKGSVTADGTMAVLLGIGALASLGAPPVAVMLGLGGAMYTGSAFYGSSSANKCRAAIARYEEREDADEMEEVAAGAPADRADADQPSRAEAPAAPEPPPPVAVGDAAPPDGRSDAPPPAEPAAPAPRPSGDWADFWVEVAP